jgi:hypothetical protein
MTFQYKCRVRFLNKNSDAADANQAAQASFYNTLTSNYNTEFSTFENMNSSLQSIIQPIISAGAGQYGYDATEDSALRTSATNTNAKSFSNESAALQNKLVQQNGGMNDLPSGAAEELQQQLGVAQAQTNASDQNAITQAGYAQGQTNYQNAMNEEFSLLSANNPNSFASSATSAGTAATGAVNAATTADSGWMSVVGGALTGAGTAAGGIFQGKG